MDRNELQARIQDGRAELMAALGHFERHALTEPKLPNGWSVKDLIAHIGFWERRIANLYDILSSGEVPKDTIANESLDRLNARVYEENQLLPLGIVQINEEEAFQSLLGVAINAPERDLFDPQRFAWTQGEPFYNWIVENTYGHYADHVPDLTAAIDQE